MAEAPDQFVPPAGGLPDLGGFDGKMPSVEEILKLIDGMDFGEEEKEKLKQDLLGGAQKVLGGMGRQVAKVGAQEYLVFLAMILLIAGVFAFFGYKLYKSLVEKEQRKLEKQKAKQQKKKK